MPGQGGTEMTWRTPATLLSQETRRALVERVRAEPGLTVGQLAEGLGITWKTAEYHARLLERAGALVVDRDGRRSSCYLCGVAPAARRFPPRVVAALEALRDGPASSSAVARSAGLPRSTAYTLLRRLEARGFAFRQGDGWTLAPGVDAALTGEGFSRRAS